MPGRLRHDELDVTNDTRVQELIDALIRLAGDPSRTFPLIISKRFYFKIDGGQLLPAPGWYAIQDDVSPLYVGTAANLNNRLNSENGSRDQFANPQRETDPARNFIKAFTDMGVIRNLRVTVIDEPTLCNELALGAPLSRRDRHNIEKVLNIFRGRILNNQIEYVPDGR